MLTFLSWSFQTLIDAALSRAAVPARQDADSRPLLRLVGTGQTPDIAIAARGRGAPESAFVAGGEGARLYSLEAFRRERSGGPSPRQVA